MHTPGRGDEALRRYRTSLPSASYFLTLCTAERARGLTSPTTALAIRNECNAIESDGHWVQRATVIMPDHVHLLAKLTGSLFINRCVARLKTKTKSALTVDRLEWQPNFYEHRLRPDDNVGDVLRYIFLNPFRANLVNPSEAYPYFWLGATEAEWFNLTTDHGEPFPEWLK